MASDDTPETGISVDMEALYAQTVLLISGIPLLLATSSTVGAYRATSSIQIPYF